jgi:hypothetical protein
MSSDEQTDARDRKDRDDEDVEAHQYVADDAQEDDPLRKRKRKQADEPESDEFGKPRKRK